MQFFKWLGVEDWKRAVALVILWAYAYQLVAWPLLSWGATLVTALAGLPLPVPPVTPWEHLMAGTVTLASIGGIQTWRDKLAASAEPAGGAAP
jgi:hypothetical protein